MSFPLTYAPGFVADPGATLETLLREVDWESRQDAPRSERWMNPLGTPYTYGRGAGERTYQPAPYHPVVADIASSLSELGCQLDACFLNRYDNHRQHLGWHADDSPEIDQDRPIAVVSLGAERFLYVRENGSENHERVLMENGSLLIMHAGMQITHQHRVPKHHSECGVRVSLTYRGLIGVR